MSMEEVEKGETLTQGKEVSSSHLEDKTHDKKKREFQSVDLDNSRAFKGDDSDGKIEWSVKTFLAFISLAGLNAGSQLIVYFVGGCLSYIAADIGGAADIGWLPTANILAVASIAPYTGYLEDLLGRRNIALVGTLLLCIGCILLGTAHNMGQALAGMSISGAGAAVGELTALAGIADVVPVKRRGLAVGLLTLFIIPFAPSVLYAQLLASRATWRWGAWYVLIYNGLVLLGLSFTYFPQTHPRAEGLSSKQVLGRIDYMGGFLSICGLALFLVSLQSGGHSHSWTSAYVLCTLLIGISLILAFVVWEWKGAKYPMVPGALFQGQYIVGLAFGIAFVAGMNFYSLLNVYPLTYSAVYNPDPVKVGTKAVGVALCVIVGAVVGNSMLSIWIGGAKYILMMATIIMTAFTGAIAVLKPTNPGTTVTIASLAGIGVGGILVPAATVAMIVVPDSVLATTVALSLSIRSVGGSIGYSIYYSILQNKLTNKLPTYIADYAIKAGLRPADAENFVVTYLNAPTELLKLPGVNESILAAATLGSQWAYADSLRYVFYTSIAFGSMAIIACCFLPSLKRYGTNRIAAKV